MSYQSPLHILESFDVDVKLLDQEALVRLRKKLLAEFNLTRQITIKVNKQEYTKDEIINQIDTLKNLEDLDTHVQLFKNKDILNFCENPRKASNPVEVLSVVFDDASTTSHAKSILLEAELTSLKYHLNNLDFTIPHKIIRFINHLGMENVEDVYDIVGSTLDHIEDLIDSVSNETYKKGKYEHVKFLKRLDFYLFLNELPEEFSISRNNISVSVINFTVRIQQKDISFVRAISKNLLWLNCDPENKRLIKDNHKAYLSPGAGANSNVVMLFRILVVGLLCLRACIR
ncbi:MAG: hypothetical protein PSX81_10335 [bacterium]|nr:hypothetical protein [bacterium]